MVISRITFFISVTFTLVDHGINGVVVLKGFFQLEND